MTYTTCQHRDYQDDVKIGQSSSNEWDHTQWPSVSADEALHEDIESVLFGVLAKEMASVCDHTQALHAASMHSRSQKHFLDDL